MKKVLLFLAVALCLCLCIFTPENQVSVSASVKTDPAAYYDVTDGTIKFVDDYTYLEGKNNETEPTVLTTGWYVVMGTFKYGLDIQGDVNIIILDSSYTTINSRFSDGSINFSNIGDEDFKAGIHVTGDNKLTIWGQASGIGQIYVYGSVSAAAIGGDYGEDSGTIVINGGTIHAVSRNGGAAIGGGVNGCGKNITINGGRISATGSTYYDRFDDNRLKLDWGVSACIGGGAYDKEHKTGDAGAAKDITINGGVIDCYYGSYLEVDASAIGSGVYVEKSLGTAENKNDRSSVFINSTLKANAAALNTLISQHSGVYDATEDLLNRATVQLYADQYLVQNLKYYEGKTVYSSTNSLFAYAVGVQNVKTGYMNTPTWKWTSGGEEISAPATVNFYQDSGVLAVKFVAPKAGTYTLTVTFTYGSSQKESISTDYVVEDETIVVKDHNFYLKSVANENLLASSALPIDTFGSVINVAYPFSAVGIPYYYDADNGYYLFSSVSITSSKTIFDFQDENAKISCLECFFKSSEPALKFKNLEIVDFGERNFVIKFIGLAEGQHVLSGNTIKFSNVYNVVHVINQKSTEELFDVQKIDLGIDTAFVGTDPTLVPDKTKATISGSSVKSGTDVARYACIYYYTVPVTIEGLGQSNGENNVTYNGKAQVGYSGTAVCKNEEAQDITSIIGQLDVLYYMNDGYTKTTPENSGAASEGAAPVNPGSYKVVLKVRDEVKGYAGKIEFSFTIQKAPNTISNLTMPSWERIGQPSTPSCNAIEGSVTYHYYGTGTTTYDSDEIPLELGTYKVVATSETISFYVSATAEVEFSVTKRLNPITNLKMDSWEKIGTPSTPSCDVAHGTVTYHYYGTGSTSYDSDVIPTELGSYKVVASVPEDEDYEASTAFVEFRITKRINHIHDLTMDSWRINKTASAPSATADHGEITFTYVGVDSEYSSDIIPTEVGKYKVVASIPEDEDYEACVAELEFEILPEKKANAFLIILLILLILIGLYIAGYFFLYKKGKLEGKAIEVIYSFLPDFLKAAKEWMINAWKKIVEIALKVWSAVVTFVKNLIAKIQKK